MLEKPYVFAIIAIAFLVFFAIAWRDRKKSWRLATFFMGGRNIGAPLTEQTFWGTSFSFANGLYYFAALAYFKGLAVVWLQIPWIIAILFLAWQLPLLIRITERYTLHGFLGSLYGRRTAVVASIVTTVGFLATIAFEINVSSEIIAKALGSPEIIIPLTLVAGLTVAAYTDAGGFLGAAKTDRAQNVLGVMAVAVLFVALWQFLESDGVSREGGSPFDLTSIWHALFDFSSFDRVSTIGVLCFATTTNLVDMSNWQTIAANSAAGPSKIAKLRWAMARSGFWILILPAAAGAFIGHAFRGLSIGGSPTADIDILPRLIASVGDLPMGNVLLGVVCAGLIATALSTVDSYMLSSSQTIVWDLRLEAEKALIITDSEERAQYEQRSVRRARNEIYWYTLLACIGFIALRRLIGDQTVFVLQFVIFGMITALAPATLFALWLRSRDLEPPEPVRRIVGMSIACGLLANLVCLALSISTGNNFDAFAVTPTVTLGTASIVCGIGAIIFLRRKRGGEG